MTIQCYMSASGRKYVAESAADPSDSLLPVCTQELLDLLATAGKPLNDAEIAQARLTLGDDNAIA